MSDVGHDAAREQALEQVDGVGHDADRDRLAAVARRERALDRRVERRRHLVEVARLEPALDARRGRPRRRGTTPSFIVDRERLRAAHAAEAGGDDEPAGERAAEVLARALRRSVSYVPCRMPCVPM